MHDTHYEEKSISYNFECLSAKILLQFQQTFYFLLQLTNILKYKISINKAVEKKNKEYIKKNYEI